MRFKLELVQRAEVIEHGASGGRGQTRRIAQVEHGLVAAPKFYPLIAGGQKSGPPVEIVEYLTTAGPLAHRGHHGEGRQIVGLAAQAVSQPGSQGGTSGNLGAAEH